MYTYPLTQENLRGVTSVILEAICGPEYIHEEGGNSHGNIYDSDSDEGNIDEDGNAIGVFTSVANADDLDISDEKNSNGGGDSSDNDTEDNTNQINNDKEELEP